MIVRYRRISESVELGKLGNIVPYFFVVGMEDMCSIFMYVYSFDFFCVNVSCNVISLVYYKNFFSMFFACCAKTAPYRPEPMIK